MEAAQGHDLWEEWLNRLTVGPFFDKSDAPLRWLADGGTAVSRRGRQGVTEGGWYHRGRVNDYAFAHEFDDTVSLAALEEYEGNGRRSV
eukprot:SAG11_NODE_4791_length_1765_cov_2.259304_1_plen_88_part_10